MRIDRLFLGRPQTGQEHLDALDGLRGLAFLIVLASHMSFSGLHLVPGLALTGVGKSGVYLFFVLSAFLLTRALLGRPPRGFASGRLWANYALRRVLRIWPLYLVVLVSSWWLSTGGLDWWPYPLDTAELLRHLRLQEGKSVLWSIPVEFKFYLLLPGLALLLAWVMRLRWHRVAEPAMAVALLAAATWAWPPGDTAGNDVRLGPYLVVFLCGAFAARLDRGLLPVSSARAKAAWGAFGALALAAAAVSIPEVWATLTATEIDRRVSHQWFLFFGLVWSSLLLAVLRGPSWLRAPFAWWPARLVGIVSFSAYLWHMPLLDALNRAGVQEAAGSLAPLLVVAIVVAVSCASYLLIERPWRHVRLAPAQSRPAAADLA